jgi:hypothetical protein
MKGLLVAGVSLIVLAGRAEAEDIMVTKAVPIQYAVPSAYYWTGFYAGGHFGVARGTSNLTAPPGSLVTVPADAAASVRTSEYDRAYVPVGIGRAAAAMIRMRMRMRAAG